jgi:hypothetical protein
VPAGQLGQATTSWNTYRTSEGRVTLVVDGGPEERFAEGQCGLKMFDGIKPQARYQFRLYSSPETPAAETVEVSAAERIATIVAEPNPVPTSSGSGRTRIFWTTLNDAESEIYMSRDGGPEYLFGRGRAGSQEANWIAVGSHYEFRLYTSESPRRLLANIIVTR